MCEWVPVSMSKYKTIAPATPFFLYIKLMIWCDHVHLVDTRRIDIVHSGKFVTTAFCVSGVTAQRIKFYLQKGRARTE